MINMIFITDSFSHLFFIYQDGPAQRESILRPGDRYIFIRISAV